MRILRSDEEALDLLNHEPVFSAPSFSEYLRRQMNAHDMTVSQLIAAADISKTHMYQLLRGERHAGRDVVLRFALILGLSVEEACRLLTLSGNSILYPRIRRDAAIIYAISKGMSLIETEQLLASLPERSLYLWEV